MLSSRFAFLSLVLGVVGYVNASLLSSADSLTNVDPCIQPNPCDPTIVGNCPTNDAIDNVLTQHAPDVSVFWGGHYNNTTIREKAEDCAKLKNGLTIGMVLCKYNITMPAKPDDPLWQHASQTYAKQAKGRAFATIGESLFETASFFNIELPALIGNPQVRSIISVDAGTQDFKELCYWHCGGKDCTVGIISYAAILNFI